MGNRRKSREYALQMLYAADISRQVFKRICQWFWQDPDRSADKTTRAYAEQLAGGVLKNQGRIDALVESHSLHWKVNRMSIVDRNILRLATYELLSGDVPAAAVINEAIELAKHYGDDESPQFINGVLDAIHHTIPRHPTFFSNHE